MDKDTHVKQASVVTATVDDQALQVEVLSSLVLRLGFLCISFARDFSSMYRGGSRDLCIVLYRIVSLWRYCGLAMFMLYYFKEGCNVYGTAFHE